MKQICNFETDISSHSETQQIVFDKFVEYVFKLYLLFNDWIKFVNYMHYIMVKQYLILIKDNKIHELKHVATSYVFKYYLNNFYLMRNSYAFTINVWECKITSPLSDKNILFLFTVRLITIPNLKKKHNFHFVLLIPKINI